MSLVSIGIPTFNRLDKLKKTLPYLLAQNHSDIEIVISDNGSTDGTEQFCREWAQHDARISYIRQPANVGPTANYRRALTEARGKYYVALADDDWLDRNYVSECVRALEHDSSLATVCGVSHMYRDGAFSHDSPVTNVEESSGSDRVVNYYSSVAENGAFHGVTSRQLLLSLPTMSNTMGGDWYWVAAIAFSGNIRTLQSTGIIKHIGGTSRTYESITSVLGLPSWHATYWMEIITAYAVSDIAWRSPVYASLGMSGRLKLAARVLATLAHKFGLPYGWYRAVRGRIIPYK